MKDIKTYRVVFLIHLFFNFLKPKVKERVQAVPLKTEGGRRKTKKKGEKLRLTLRLLLGEGKEKVGERMWDEKDVLL